MCKKNKDACDIFKVFFILLFFTLIPHYIAWVILLAIFIADVIFHIRAVSIFKMPGSICYWFEFALLFFNGLFLFEPFNGGYWPLARDIINMSFVFLYCFLGDKFVKKIDLAAIYRAVILFSTVIALKSLIERFSGYQGIDENFNEFVSRGSMSEFTIAIALYLILFKPPCISKVFFNKILDLLIAVILWLIFVVSFSRTAIIILLCLIIIGKYDHMSALFKILLLFIIGMVGISYFLPDVLNAFIIKIRNSTHEISAFNNWTEYNIVNNWRGFEVYSAKNVFSRYDIVHKLLGKGFGAYIEVGGYAYLVTSENALPYLHNGYYTTLIKGGFVGFVLTIMYYFELVYYYWKRNISQYEKRLCIGLIIAMALSMTVIHGFFWGGAQLLVLLLFTVIGRKEEM